VTDDATADLRRTIAEQAVPLANALSRTDSLLSLVAEPPPGLDGEINTMRQHIEALKALAPAEVVGAGGTVDEAAAAVAGVTPQPPQPQQEPTDD
jgi:hypothetical protein